MTALAQRELNDNTTLFICQLKDHIQQEIQDVLNERLLSLDDVDEFDIRDMMSERLCNIYDGEIIHYDEVLKWSNNKSIYE